MASTRKVKPQVVLMRRQKQLEDEQPLATVEIVERATAGVKGLAVADALRIWKALGSYVSAQLARGKAVKLEHLGLFALNASSEPIFLHNAVFLQTNRLRERTRHGSPGSLQAIGTAQCGSFSSVNMSEIGSRFLPNYSKEIVAAVIANVVAHVGNLAKQGRVLRLGFLPIGEWTCDGDVAGFKFLAEFYAQIKLQRTIRTVKMGVSDNGDVESPQESLSHNYEKEHQDLPRPRSSKAAGTARVCGAVSEDDRLSVKIRVVCFEKPSEYSELFTNPFHAIQPLAENFNR
uniref:CCDC81 HU domain-containing protein n=1 Tax=Globisporangium ultimum (strain ATCC 200006 / CBS 805.95 / DAOM BR144) TaxID=431595 RepID=K3WZJ0_GLOUD